MISRYSRPEMGQIWAEKSRFETMLKVEILATEALVKKGKVPKSAFEKIKRCAVIDVDRIGELEKTVKHDVIAFLTQVGERIGPEARFLHWGMTSSDVLDTATSVQLVQATDLLIQDLQDLAEIIKDQARRYKNTLMIGRSHGIHAEPITFGFKLACWYTETQRGLDRLKRAREVVRVGKISGAVGTFAHLDPSVEAYVCQKLGLKPAEVSTQILQRDRHAEYMAHLAVVAGSLERFATEIRHLQRTEVLEAEEPFTPGQKGSSAMPHKRNPIGCENLCGLARLIRSYALSAMENEALWHERDISHSSVERVIFPDATILLDFMIVRFTKILAGLQVYPENMKKNLEKTAPLIVSQRILLALVDKGVRREDAYAWVQRHAMDTWKVQQEGGQASMKDFLKRLKADKDIAKRLSAKELESCTDLTYYVRQVPAIFKRAGL